MSEIKKQNIEESIGFNYSGTLQIIQKQYQKYIDINALTGLPLQSEREQAYYTQPSMEHPLTTNTIKTV